MLGKLYTGLFICVQIIKLSQQQECSFYQQLDEGRSYYIFNAGYPSMTRGYNCVFEVFDPSGHHIGIKCVINIDTDGNTCGTERLYIALDGDLHNADVFCGKGAIERTSKSNRIKVVYESSAANGSGFGGRFLCSLVAQPIPCDCGWTQTLRIVGGEDVHEGEYPSVAGIIDAKTRLIFCGGTIISHRFVVSAKHCFEPNVDISTIAVGVGIIDTTNGSKYGALYRIHSILSPPGDKNDIALVKTAANIRWSSGVAPACLPFLQKNDTFADEDVILLGWGLDEVLQKVQAKVISNSNCSRYNPSITDKQMCTFAPGKDACQIDSGGPVLYVKNRQILIGIVRNGSICGEEAPGVNTRITSYLDWIESVVVSGDRLCYKKFD